jgi:GNAT superfamily N-acetyltransferase
MTDSKKALAILIFKPSTPRHFAGARELFQEYVDFLYSLPDMRVHVDSQDPATEMAELEAGSYAPPDGALLLASHEDDFVGVVALRKLTEETCEMKRLYVRPKWRAASVGIQLAQAIITTARDMGYQRMWLDTHPAMTKAHQLYYSLGFNPIPRYNENIVPGVLFLELDLKGSHNK